MKTNLALFLLGVGVAASLRAQAPEAIQYAPGSLEQLVAPIALYPDPLIALILPAATASTDLVLAARYLEQNGNVAQIDAQPWDPSVKALAHYPDVVTWMDANLAWTQALGQAYALQPTAVMQAVQAMRAKALAAGTLQNTPQQQVVMDSSVIEIVPMEPSVIYVPSYDWNVVYDAGPSWGYPLVTFRLCYPIGPWLQFDCDWRDHRIVSRGWRRDWDDRRDRDFARDRDIRSDRDFTRDRDLRRDGNHWNDRRPEVAGRFATPPAAPRNPAQSHFAPRPGNWPQNTPLARNPAPGQRPNRGMVAPPAVRTSQPNYPVVNAPRHDFVRPIARPPVQSRGPVNSYVQSAPPRNFSARNEGARPAYQPSQRPAVQYSAPRASAPQNDRGESTRRQGQSAR